MKQSHFQYLGIAILLIAGGLTLALGPQVLLSVTGVTMVLAGSCALIAGRVAELIIASHTVTYREFAGLSFGFISLLLPTSYIPVLLKTTPTMVDIFLLAMLLLASVRLLVTGVQLSRGESKLDLTKDVDECIERA